MIELKDVKIELIDLDRELVQAWSRAFSDCANIVPLYESIIEAHTSAIVSPANSFGYMDGGVDLVLSHHFGWQLEENVRAKLLQEHAGELPVGQAIIVPTSHAQVPWLISAPTMRVPMNVSHTTHAYLAFRAVLLAIQSHNRDWPEAQIESVACPGLGTGCGLMPAKRCAKQMRYAYEVCVHGALHRKGGLARAARQHMDLIDHES